MSEVLLVKEGYTLSVDETCVQAHIKAGWAEVKAGVSRLGSELDTEVKTYIQGLGDRITSLEAKVELQAKDIELACEVEAGGADGSEKEALAARVAELEQRKASTGLERHEHPLLARLKAKLEALV